MSGDWGVSGAGRPESDTRRRNLRTVLITQPREQLRQPLDRLRAFSAGCAEQRYVPRLAATQEDGSIYDLQ